MPFPTDTGTPEFGNENERTLRVEVDGGAWLKPGAAIAYRGDLRFERRHTLDAGSISDAALRETAPLVRAIGTGRLYCGWHGAHVRVIRLVGEELNVAWKDLLAFEGTLDFESSLVGHGLGIASGGVVVTKVTGHGALALLTHGQPLILDVSTGNPLSTDPHATLAWSSGLDPALKTDLTWHSAFGHGGQEPVQMYFEGAGQVYVQPYRHTGWFEAAGPHVMKKVAAVFTA